VDHGEEAGSEDDAAKLPSVPVQQGAALTRHDPL
jgi:hypothetical protein